MDVPAILENTGGRAFGSANSCQLLGHCGVPKERVSEIHSGDCVTVGGFHIEAREAQHVKLPGFGPGTLAPDLKIPLKAREYVMDNHTSYRISVNGLRLLTDPGVQARDAGEADVLFVSAGLSRSYYESLLELVQPRLVVPIHWDDFFRPLSEPTERFWKHPRRGWPPLERVSLAEFRLVIQSLSPDTSMLVPEALRTYTLEELL
jgi:L-ascorbate metabolism protein UlaG (beta-lactamase superfamily)